MQISFSPENIILKSLLLLRWLSNFLHLCNLFYLCSQTLNLCFAIRLKTKIFIRDSLHSSTTPILFNRQFICRLCGFLRIFFTNSFDEFLCMYSTWTTRLSTCKRKAIMGMGRSSIPIIFAIKI